MYWYRLVSFLAAFIISVAFDFFSHILYFGVYVCALIRVFNVYILYFIYWWWDSRSELNAANGYYEPYTCYTCCTYMASRRAYTRLYLRSRKCVSEWNKLSIYWEIVGFFVVVNVCCRKKTKPNSEFCQIGWLRVRCL